MHLSQFPSRPAIKIFMHATMTATCSGKRVVKTFSSVTDAQGVSEMVMMAREVHVASALQRYVVAFADASRKHPDVYLGASPRASIMPAIRMAIGG